MIRHILSARVALPRVQAALKGIVEAATWMSAADGTLREDEVDALVDAVRRIAEAAVGPELLEQVASTPQLLDWARATRGRLANDGLEAVLAGVVSALEGDFKHAALVVAHRVIAADGTVTADEARAFRRLTTALSLADQEAEALSELAEAGPPIGAPPLPPSDVDTVKALRTSGWTDASAGPEEETGLGGPPWDVAVEYSSTPREKWHTTPGPHTVLRLELDAQERALHLHATDEAGRGTHLLLFTGDRLSQVVGFLDEVKDVLTAPVLEAVPEKLLELCPTIFTERGGRLAKVRR